MSTRSVVFLISICMLFSACSKAPLPPEPPRPVLTMVLGTSADTSISTYSGEVRSRYETALGFRIGGKISARLVDAGAQVKAGEVLARFFFAVQGAVSGL